MTSSNGFRTLLRSGSVVAIAMAIMNVATYGFQMIAARTLGPQPYGALAALMNTLLVFSVIQLGLQATAARRIAADPGQTDQIERIIVRVTGGAALALGGLLLVLSPVLNGVLRLESLPTAALVALAAIPLTVMGGQAGVLQGERRWGALAAVYIAAGVPRLIIGGLFIVASPTETSAMLAVALAAFAPVLVGSWALRRPHHAPRGHQGLDDAIHAARKILAETAHNSQALFAFFALSSVDVIVARNVLDAHDAGLYAGGVILTKATLFLPQFVVVVAFPEMSSENSRRHALTRSLMLVAGLGVATTLGTWLLSDLALIFVGGEQFAEIGGRLWAFAVIGTLLSLLQLLVYFVLARRSRRSAVLPWIALVVLVVVGLRVDSLDSLILAVIVVDSALFILLLAISLIRIGPDRAPEPVSVSSVVPTAPGTD